MAFDASFWVFVATVLFLVVFFKPLGRLILGGLDQRSAAIDARLQEVMALKEEAQSMLAKYQRQHQKLEEDIENITAHAEEEAARIIRHAEEHSRVQIERQTALANEKIARAEQAAMKDIKDHAVDIMVKTAQQMIIEHMDRDAAQHLLDDALNEIDRKLH